MTIKCFECGGSLTQIDSHYTTEVFQCVDCGRGYSVVRKKFVNLLRKHNKINECLEEHRKLNPTWKHVYMNRRIVSEFDE